MTKNLLILALSLAAAPAFATGEHANTYNAEVDRTVEFNAGDMWFDPESLDVTPSETIKFTVTNTGSLKHEFVIGSTEAQKEHREMMQNMSDNDHGSDGHGHGGPGDGMPSVTIKPGETAELVWNASKNMEALEYACNIPGHYEAGMHGSINFQGSSGI